jgi:hypothetical protein
MLLLSKSNLPTTEIDHIIKSGHPQFKSAPPQLRNIAENQMDFGVAD